MERNHDPILTAEHLKKYFPTPKGMLHAVDDVSFSIARGQTLGVVGESGCGKSTLGRVIQHLIRPTEGTIIFDGEDITNPSRKKIKELQTKMQFIFQDPYSSLNPRMSVQEIVMEPLLIAGVRKQQAQEAVDQILDIVGLARRFANAYPHEMDGGRRQRVGIARALVLNPKFVICDEPVSALDVSIQAQILNLLQDLQEQRNLTYIFITHDLSVVKHISDNIMVMYLGQMVEYSDSKNIFKNPLHPYTQALLSAVPSIDIDRPHERMLLKGELTSPINPKPGCRFAARCPKATKLCRECQPCSKEVESGHYVACHLYD